MSCKDEDVELLAKGVWELVQSLHGPGRVCLGCAAWQLALSYVNAADQEGLTLDVMHLELDRAWDARAELKARMASNATGGDA